MNEDDNIPYTKKFFAKTWGMAWPFLAMLVVYVTIYVVTQPLAWRGNSHSFEYEGSTPLAMADMFLWWQPVTIVILFVTTCLFLRKTMKWSRIYSVIISLFWFVPLSILILLAHFEPPPEGATMIPQVPYWGWNFSYIGSRFVRDNFWLFLVYVSYPTILLFFRPKNCEETGKKTPWKWWPVLAAGYLLCLAPFIATGAWVCGHVEYRVDKICGEQLAMIHVLLLRFAADHENRLPVAEDFHALWPQIEPYMGTEARKRWRKPESCLIGNALDRPPKPFLWNSKLSGKEVVVGLKKYDHFNKLMNEPEPFPDTPVISGFGKTSRKTTYYLAGKPWVDCPYNPWEEANSDVWNRFELPGELFDGEKFRRVPWRNFRDIPQDDEKPDEK